MRALLLGLLIFPNFIIDHLLSSRSCALGRERSAFPQRDRFVTSRVSSRADPKSDRLGGIDEDEALDTAGAPRRPLISARPLARGDATRRQAACLPVDPDRPAIWMRECPCAADDDDESRKAPASYTWKRIARLRRAASAREGEPGRSIRSRCSIADRRVELPFTLPGRAAYPVAPSRFFVRLVKQRLQQPAEENSMKWSFKKCIYVKICTERGCDRCTNFRRMLIIF